MVKSVLCFVVFVLEVDLELHESPAFDRGKQLEAVLAKDQVVPRVVPPVVVAAAGLHGEPQREVVHDVRLQLDFDAIVPTQR